MADSLLDALITPEERTAFSPGVQSRLTKARAKAKNFQTFGLTDRAPHETLLGKLTGRPMTVSQTGNSDDAYLMSKLLAMPSQPKHHPLSDEAAIAAMPRHSEADMAAHNRMFGVTGPALTTAQELALRSKARRANEANMAVAAAARPTGLGAVPASKIRNDLRRAEITKLAESAALGRRERLGQLPTGTTLFNALMGQGMHPEDAQMQAQGASPEAIADARNQRRKTESEAAALKDPFNQWAHAGGLAGTGMTFPQFVAQRNAGMGMLAGGAPGGMPVDPTAPLVDQLTQRRSQEQQNFLTAYDAAVKEGKKPPAVKGSPYESLLEADMHGAPLNLIDRINGWMPDFLGRNEWDQKRVREVIRKHLTEKANHPKEIVDQWLAEHAGRIW